ncbi:MAG: YebC/PmpR family DNA-binding transcriptional regulator [Alphaproteobacteria bacterium]
MAGHSHAKNVMHRKQKQDALKAKIFTPIIREIMVAARAGGGDPRMNASLARVLEKARAANMTKDVMERAVKRGTGEIKGEDYVERVYEGRGPGGTSFIIKTMSDNGTRTFTSVRTAFTKNGGQVGTDGSVAYMFKECGRIAYPASIGAEDAVTEVAIEAGADDFSVEEGDEGKQEYVILTQTTDFAQVKAALEAKYGETKDAKLTYIPQQMQAVADLETAQSVMKLYDILEEDDDVQQVIMNAEFSDDIAGQL